MIYMDKIYFLAFLLLIFRISTACGASNNALIDKSQNLLNNHPEVRRIQNSKILKIANVRDLFFKNLSAEGGNLKADFFFGIIYGCDGNYEYRGIFICGSGICIITRNKDDVGVEFFAYDSMSDTQKNIFKKLSALYARNCKLYENYNGDFSRFGIDTSIALFICKTNNNTNQFIIDCIGHNSISAELTVANEIYELSLEAYKSFIKNSHPLSGA